MKLMWPEIKDNHLYVYWRGTLIYKRWIGKNNKKTQPSILLSKKGWPNEWIV